MEDQMETICVLLFLAISSVLIISTAWTYKIRFFPRHKRKSREPITILKPLKGIDEGLEENLISFFKLNYPKFELIFSIASKNDPALPLVKRLIGLYPNVDAKLILGDSNVGLNPKICNLIRPFSVAKYEFTLISASNVRVEPCYLRNLIQDWTDNTGVLTSLVSGTNPRNLLGHIELALLSCFYARALSLADITGNAFAIGKSMLFLRQDLIRLGGLEILSNYLAEDYMMGELMKKIGKKVTVARRPVYQYLGKHTSKQFTGRHLRWGQIRRSHAQILFAFEPLLHPVQFIISGGIIWKTAQMGEISQGLVVSLFLLTSIDLFQWLIMGASGGSRIAPAIILQHVFVPFFWLFSLRQPVFNWRGQLLRLKLGGVLEPLHGNPLRNSLRNKWSRESLRAARQESR